jgi:hypothetical protein
MFQIISLIASGVALSFRYRIGILIIYLPKQTSDNIYDSRLTWNQKGHRFAVDNPVSGISQFN